VSTEATSILVRALMLSEAERRQLGEALLDSVPPEDADSIGAAWNEEILRRVAQIEGGEVEMVDGPTGVAEIRERLSMRRA
jgi:putative addiction module component (TIGR02574 family)